MQKVVSGKSVEEAKEILLENLNLDEYESYEIEVVQEPVKGFLGIGSKEAEVRLVIKTDKENKAKHLVSEISKHMGYEVEFETAKDEETNRLKFEFKGDGSDQLFSRVGRSAKKFEFLVNCMINRKDREDYLKVVFEHEKIKTDRPNRRSRKPRAERDDSVEAEKSTEETKTENRPKGRRNRDDKRRGDSRDGRSRGPRNNRGRGERGERGERKGGHRKSSPAREQFLISTAKKSAQQVLETHQSVKLNPMNSYDRRIIHSNLSDQEHIQTRSEGEGDARCVVIEYVE